MSIPFPEKHKITNLFTNPDMVTTSGDVVVWEEEVLNPRGRPSDTSSQADPLGARAALIAALEGYTNKDIVWSVDAPSVGQVVWVHPGTGQVMEYVDDWPEGVA